MNKVDHIPHIEDLLFTKDASQVSRILLDILQAIKDRASHGKLTIKYDGSPSLLAGVDPEDEQFFVATKSAFNKTPIVFKNENEIYHGKISRGLRSVLYDAYFFLKARKFDFIWQGDVLWTWKELKTANRTCSFRINTLRYEPKDYMFGALFSRSKMGVAWHTAYTGDSLTELRRVRGMLPQFPLPEDYTLDLVNVAVTPTMANARMDWQDVEYAERMSYAAQVADPEIPAAEWVTIYKRAFAANKKADLDFLGLLNAIDQHYVKVANGYKTTAGYESAITRRIDAIKWTQQNQTKVEALYRAYHRVRNVKLLLLDVLEPTSILSAYLPDGTPTKQEGFVYNDGHLIVKLVDRDVFTRANAGSAFAK